MDLPHVGGLPGDGVAYRDAAPCRGGEQGRHAGQLVGHGPVPDRADVRVGHGGGQPVGVVGVRVGEHDQVEGALTVPS